MRGAIAMLASLGLWGVAFISLEHWAGTSSCPMIGAVPACHVISVGYGLIVLSMLWLSMRARFPFLVGWLPVLALALTGMTGELTGQFHCPQTAGGVPKCYFSASLALAIGLLAWTLFKTRNSQKERATDAG